MKLKTQGLINVPCSVLWLEGWDAQLISAIIPILGILWGGRYFCSVIKQIKLENSRRFEKNLSIYIFEHFTAFLMVNLLIIFKSFSGTLPSRTPRKKRRAILLGEFHLHSVGAISGFRLQPPPPPCHVGCCLSQHGVWWSAAGRQQKIRQLENLSVIFRLLGAHFLGKKLDT